MQQLETRNDGLTNSLTSVEKDNYLIADFRNDEGLRIRKNKISPSLTSHGDSKGGVPTPMVISPCLSARKHSESDISTMAPLVIGMVRQTCEKRLFETPKEINQYLRDNKGHRTIKAIAEYLNLPKTQTEHYFRVDGCRAVPSPEIWIKLKKLLMFDNTYDNKVMEIYTKEIEFEQTRRVWELSCSPTINSTNGGHWINTTQIRRLTPTECERLQGFPDGWTGGVSDTQRYRQLGNAVTVNVIESIFEKIMGVKTNGRCNKI